MSETAARIAAIDRRRCRQRPFLHLDPALWERLTAQLAEHPTAEFQRCCHDLRPGPDRAARSRYAVWESASFVAAVTGATADRAFLATHLSMVLPAAGMGLIDLRRGEYLAACAFSYDILAGTLDAPTHDTLRRTLADHACRTAEAVAQTLNPPWALEQPAAVATVCGLALAALALYADEPEAAGWLAVADERYELVVGRVAGDGWWPTGAEDWNRLLPLLVRVADAWHRLSDLDRFDHPVFTEAWRVALHAVAPHGDSLLPLDQVGPAEAGGRGRPGDQSFSREPCRGALARLGRRFDGPGFRQALTAWRSAGLGRGTVWDVLWADEQPARPPGPPASHHRFGHAGLAIWRSGWRRDAMLVALAAGAPGPVDEADWRAEAGAHRDANQVLLYLGGEPVLTDFGAAGGPATRLHNVILADDRGQLPPDQADDPSGIALGETWLTDWGGSTVGHAAGAYHPGLGLTRFDRRLAFTADYLVWYDHLAAERPLLFQWLLNTAGTVEYQRGSPRAVFRAGEVLLQADLLRPDRLGGEVREVAREAGASRLGTQLALAAPQRVRETQFLAVWQPRTARGEASGRAALLTGEHTVGCRLSWPDETLEDVLFPTHGRGIRLDDLLADGASLSLRRQPDGEWVRLLTRRVTKVLVRGGAVLTASQPVDVSLAAAAARREVSGEVRSATGATVTVRCPFAPKGVMVDGASGRADVERGTRSVRVRLTAGDHRLRISG